MNEEKWEVIKNKFERTLEMWEIDKKCGQFTTDSIQHLFPLEIEVIINYIDELQNNWNELKKWLEECLKEQNKDRFYDNNSYQAGVIDTYENVIDKMQELEQGKDENN